MDGVRAQVEVSVEVDGGANAPSDSIDDGGPLPLTGLEASLTMLIAVVLLLLTATVGWWRRRMGWE